MHPSFDLGFTTLPAYFSLLMFGFTLAVLLAHREGVRRGMDGNTILDNGLLMMVCGLVGSRVLHVFADGHFMDYVHLCTDPGQVTGLSLGVARRCLNDAQCVQAGLGDLCDASTGLCRQGQDCLRVFKIWYGGYVYYGGLLLAVPVGIWFLARRRTSVWAMADLAGFGIPLGLVFGRLGCFLAGCCFGGTCDTPLGVAFPRWSPAWQAQVDSHSILPAAAASLPVHATQLYEAVFCLIVFVWLYRRYRRGVRFVGENFFLFIGSYAVFRFAVEFIRADERGAWLGGALSTSQLISLPLLAWAVWVLLRRRSWPPEAAFPGAPAARPAAED